MRRHAADQISQTPGLSDTVKRETIAAVTGRTPKATGKNPDSVWVTITGTALPSGAWGRNRSDETTSQLDYDDDRAVPQLAVDHRVVPVTRRVLADGETPLSAYAKLAGDRPGTFLLESAENGRSWSRWSFIGAGSPRCADRRRRGGQLVGPRRPRVPRRR